MQARTGDATSGFHRNGTEKTDLIPKLNSMPERSQGVKLGTAILHLNPFATCFHPRPHPTWASPPARIQARTVRIVAR
jgi:hypothetical protein